MDQALFEFYSKPVDDPGFLSAKSLLYRFLYPIFPHVGHVIQGTIEDYVTEGIPLTQALINNVKEELNDVSHKQSRESSKKRPKQFEDDRRSKRARSV